MVVLRLGQDIYVYLWTNVFLKPLQCKEKYIKKTFQQQFDLFLLSLSPNFG